MSPETPNIIPKHLPPPDSNIFSHHSIPPWLFHKKKICFYRHTRFAACFWWTPRRWVLSSVHESTFHLAAEIGSSAEAGSSTRTWKERRKETYLGEATALPFRPLEQGKMPDLFNLFFNPYLYNVALFQLVFLKF